MTDFDSESDRDHSSAPADPSASGSSSVAPNMGLGEFQQLIDQIYGEKDRARGLEGTFSP